MAKLVNTGDTGLGKKPLQPNWRLFEQWRNGIGIAKNLTPKETDALHLCTCKLEGVRVSTNLVPNTSGWKSFIGLEVPFLHFDFIGVSAPGEEPGHFTHTLTPIDPAGKYPKGPKANQYSSPDSFKGLQKYLAHYDTIVLGKSDGYDFDLEIFDDKLNVDPIKFADCTPEAVAKAFTKLFKEVEKRYEAKATKEVVSKLPLWLLLTIDPYNKDKFGVPAFGPQGPGILERVNTTGSPKELKYDLRYMQIVPKEKAPSAKANVTTFNESGSSVLEELSKI